MSDAFADAPVATEEQDDNELWLIAWAVVLLLVRGNATRRLSATQRTRARGLLRVKFEDDALRLAQRLVAGQLTVEAWQRAVWQAIDDYTRQMTVAGAGQMPRPATRQLAMEALRQQRPYLDGFAAVAGGMSIAALAARTRLYGGAGWAQFFRGQGDSAGVGMTEVWRARDDRGTCSQCSRRNGRYFLPGQGEMPGSICLGGGACRCVRVLEYNLEMWQQLTGRVA